MTFAPRSQVEPITRQPRPFGLFSVLTFRPDTEGRWQNGIEWEPLGCRPASGFGDVDCDPETPVVGDFPKKFIPGAPEMGEATPFHVYGSYECTPVGNTLQYAQDRATENLLTREEARVEQAIATGDLGSNSFNDVDASATFTAVTLEDAILRVEKYLAAVYGSQGVIHLSLTDAAKAIADEGIVVKGNVLQTVLGTPVVAGVGYEDGVVHGTSPLVGYRSEPFPAADPVEAGFDRNKNNLQAVTERGYVIGWDPCSLVRVTFGG